MAQTYVVKRGDTLQKIARANLGDASLYRHIAKFNGLRHPERLSVGQRLELPAPTRPRSTGRIGCRVPRLQPGR